MRKEERLEALRAFLMRKRARLHPEMLGLISAGRRRTPGLRREEVAELAGVSTAWYTYLEQGRNVHISRSVMESIADALQLSRDERIHFSWLVDQPLAFEPAPLQDAIHVNYQQVLDALPQSPAYITGRRTDILGWNRAANAVFGDLADIPEAERNVLWQLFTDTPFRQHFPDWQNFAMETLSSFRATASPYLSHPRFATFLERLQQASPTFQAVWEEQHVQRACALQRVILHPLVGELELQIASFQLSGDPDLKCCVYTAEPGSVSERKLRDLLRAAC